MPRRLNDTKVSEGKGQGHRVGWENAFRKSFCDILTLASPLFHRQWKEMFTLLISHLRDQLQRLDCVLWEFEDLLSHWQRSAVATESLSCSRASKCFCTRQPPGGATGPQESKAWGKQSEKKEQQGTPWEATVSPTCRESPVRGRSSVETKQHSTKKDQL